MCGVAITFGQADQRRIFGRFFGESIESGAGKVAGFESVGESGFVDQFAAGAIDDARAFFFM